eukprot:TRINITY_DN36672_c0_g1_i1.p1 TRINITY_DN36672_c0_g1~~TRINITY_DN36672_c0_g1_i1.p1  ORF type:complete len:257 (-),score=69.38 TRINITY_DN36672_c0_g1_i1:344-1045(-)
MMMTIPEANSDAGKIFAGGLPKNCKDEQLLAWASQFGGVVSAEVKMDNATGMPRGFGFITFLDPAVAEQVVANNENNIMEGKKIECKAFGAQAKGTGKSAGMNDPTNPKMFIGGLPKTATEEGLQVWLSQFGEFTEVIMKKDAEGLCCGFAFVTFADASSAKMVLDNYDNNMFEGKWIDCKSSVKGGSKGKDWGFGGKGDMKGMMGMMKGMMAMMKGKGKGGFPGKGKGWGPY